MNKTLFSPTNVLLFLLTLAGVLWLLPAFAPDGNDREIFRFIGRSISDQFAPYRDVFDHKPPFIYLIFLDFQIFGDYDVLISGLFFLIICLLLFNRIISGSNEIWRLLILGLLIVWLRNPAFYEYGGLTREFSAYLYCIFFYCFYTQQRIEWLALITGIVFITQQNDILPLLPLLIYQFRERREFNLLRIVKIKMAFLVPLVLILLWLIWQGAFYQFVQDAFIFNFTYYTTPLKNIIPHGLSLVKKVPLLTLSILILIYYLKQNLKFSYFLVILLAIVFTIYNIMVSGRFYGHYFLPLGSVLAFCFFEVVRERKPMSIKNLGLFVSLAGCFITLFWLNKNFSLNEQKAFVAQNTFINMQIETKIRENSEAIEKLCFINYSPGLKFHELFHLKPPSKYVYFSIWDEIPNWDSKLIEFDGYLSAIAAHSTLVFDFSISHPFIRDEMNKKMNNAFKSGNSFIGQLKDKNQNILANIYLTKGNP